MNLFLEDIEVLFNVLKVEIIRPTLNQTFDAREMKINTTLSNAGKMSNTVAEVIKVGYKIRLKNRYKILSEAIVDIYIN